MNVTNQLHILPYIIIGSQKRLVYGYTEMPLANYKEQFTLHIFFSQ